MRVPLLSALSAFSALGISHALHFRGGDVSNASNINLFPAWRIPTEPSQMKEFARAGAEEYELAVTEGPKGVVAHYCKVMDTVSHRFYNVRTPQLAPFVVPQSQANRQKVAIVIAPGGGNLYMAWDKEGVEIARWLNTLGISAFVLKYRVPTAKGTHTQLWDAQRALRVVRSQASHFDVSPSSIGLMGFSAGAKLTMEVANSIGDRSADYATYFPVDAVDQVSYAPDFQLPIYGTGPEALTAKPIPTFMAHAADDPCVNPSSTKTYCSQIKAAGQVCERKLYENGGHGVGNCKLYHNAWSGQALCDWPRLAEMFLREHVMKK